MCLLIWPINLNTYLRTHASRPTIIGLNKYMRKFYMCDCVFYRNPTKRETEKSNTFGLYGYAR